MTNLKFSPFFSSKLRLGRSRPGKSRQGATGLGVVIFLLIAGVVAYGGYHTWHNFFAKKKEPDFILHSVSRDDFSLAVTERGEVESAGVTEIRSEVKTKNSPGLAILRIVPEGTEVTPGDFLVELDSSALQEEQITQMLSVNAAEALVTEALNIYETAIISRREYFEGTYVQERQTIESEVFVAEENLSRAKEYYEYSKRLAAKGHVNQLQLEADKFAVEKSRKELEAAKTKLRVLDDFTKEKMLKQLDSDIKIAEARWQSLKKALQLEVNKLKDIEDQISKCTITAPRAGTVVYAHDSDRRGEQDFIVEEGAVIRERQTIIRLPDSNAMQVVVNVNESLIQFVRPGLPALISLVGIDDRSLRGTVKSVNQYAEPSGWRKANVKEYKAYVTVDELAPKMRSGMTASVTIQCDYVRDALQVPVQSVYAHGEDFYCFVYNGQQWEARPVDCGPTNDRFFVINDGLNEADQVAMNPRRFVELVDLPKLAPERAQRAVDSGPQLPPVERAAEQEDADDRTVASRNAETSAAGG